MMHDQPDSPRPGRQEQGFTLVELIMVMVLLGILSASFLVFFRPMLDAYVDAQRRADLSDLADTALRRMMQELRTAVPNSVNLVNQNCFQFVPSIGGGRYRLDLDATNDVAPPCVPSATCSAFPNPAGAAGVATPVDILVRDSGAAIAAGDFLAINSQSQGAFYGAAGGAVGGARYTVNAVAAAPRASDGVQRVTLSRNPAAGGYAGGRFQMVGAAQPSVMYSCSGGRLLRSVQGTAALAACAAAGEVVATDVAACDFSYAANPSATQANGFVSLFLQLARDGERVSLSYGVHVDNLP